MRRRLRTLSPALRLHSTRSRGQELLKSEAADALDTSWHQGECSAESATKLEPRRWGRRTDWVTVTALNLGVKPLLLYERVRATDSCTFHRQWMFRVVTTGRVVLRDSASRQATTQAPTLQLRRTVD